MHAVGAEPKPRKGTAILIATWGVFGVLGLLAQACFRLTPLAIEPIVDGSLVGWQWGLYASWVVFNAWAEGLRGFHQRFSPRVVARAFHLGRHPTGLRVLVAPLFCMSFFHASLRGKVVAWAVLAMVVTLVTLVRLVPQPWRGIIDGGVVVGLVLGSVSILYFYVLALVGRPLPTGPDLPEEDQATRRAEGATDSSAASS